MRSPTRPLSSDMPFCAVSAEKMELNTPSRSHMASEKNTTRYLPDGTGAALSPSSVRRATSPPTFCTSSPSKLRAATP